MFSSADFTVGETEAQRDGLTQHPVTTIFYQFEDVLLSV